MYLGEIIKQYRIDNHLTMEEFARLSGLSKGYISMLEKNRHPQNNKEIVPSIVTFRKVAEAMNMTIDELMNKVDGKQSVRLMNNEPDTIAAHHEGDWTEDELAEIERFKEYVKSKRGL